MKSVWIRRGRSSPVWRNWPGIRKGRLSKTTTFSIVGVQYLNWISPEVSNVIATPISSLPDRSDSSYIIRHTYAFWSPIAILYGSTVFDPRFWHCIMDSPSPTKLLIYFLLPFTWARLGHLLLGIHPFCISENRNILTHFRETLYFVFPWYSCRLSPKIHFYCPQPCTYFCNKIPYLQTT